MFGKTVLKSCLKTPQQFIWVQEGLVAGFNFQGSAVYVYTSLCWVVLKSNNILLFVTLTPPSSHFLFVLFELKPFPLVAIAHCKQGIPPGCICLAQTCKLKAASKHDKWCRNDAKHTMKKPCFQKKINNYHCTLRCSIPGSSKKTAILHTSKRINFSPPCPPNQCWNDGLCFKAFKKNSHFGSTPV